MTWLAAPTWIKAQGNTQMLDSVEVVSHRRTSSLSELRDGKINWDVATLQYMPQILGAADPIHYTQLLPGVQTSNIYDAGLHIQGGDNSHNAIMIDDIIVYNPAHLFGLFSTFNASHFSNIEIIKLPLRASGLWSRLGGALNIHSIEKSTSLDKKIEGDVSLGPVSTQGTLHILTGINSRIKVSARGSFLDPIYNKWMTFDDVKLKYGFQDYNANWTFNLSANDLIWAELYAGFDNLRLSEYTHDQNNLSWTNLMASIHWKHRIISFNGVLKQSVYYTGYECNLNYKYADKHLKMPSSIKDWGYKANYKSDHLNLSASFANRNIHPQSPRLDTSNKRNDWVENQTSREWNLGIDYLWDLSLAWSLNTGIKASLYQLSGENSYVSVDPIIALQRNNKDGSIIRLLYGWQHQYLFQTGFSDLGFPTEFWQSSGNQFAPQYSQYAAFTYNKEFHDGDYSFSSELYYRQLWHQKDYIGSVYDFFFDEYKLEDLVIEGKGWNFGVDFMLNKQTGSVTGWIGMSLGRSLRQFDNSSNIFPSSHERTFEVNGLCSWHITPKWSIGMTGTVAAGTPFTAPLYFYLMNGRVLSQYADYNTNRLPAYKRVDLAINYNIPCRHCQQSVNVSIYNAFSFDNPLYYRLKFRDGEYGYYSLGLVHWPMPSISYNLKF